MQKLYKTGLYHQSWNQLDRSWETLPVVWHFIFQEKENEYKNPNLPGNVLRKMFDTWRKYRTETKRPTLIIVNHEGKRTSMFGWMKMKLWKKYQELARNLKKAIAHIGHGSAHNSWSHQQTIDSRMTWDYLDHGSTEVCIDTE